MKLTSILLLAVLSVSTFAGDCVVSINRTACPGKETEALKPYDGKNPTEEKIAKATTEDACKKEGEKAAKIVRKGVLAKKVAKFSFDGKALGEKSDEKECK